MKFYRAGILAAGIALLSPAARAETEENCSGGNCVYRFDDGDVSSPGWSPYGDWFKLRPKSPRATLIRPRVSFVMEILKSTQVVR